MKQRQYDFDSINDEGEDFNFETIEKMNYEFIFDNFSQKILK